MKKTKDDKKLALKRLTVAELKGIAGGCGMTHYTGCVGCSAASAISRPRI